MYADFNQMYSGKSSKQFSLCWKWDKRNMGMSVEINYFFYSLANLMASLLG